MTIDPRLLDRRKTVAEENAHRSIGRLLRFLVVLLLTAALVWLAFSPWLSVSQVRTEGISSSKAHQTLSENGVVAGAPMIMLRPERVEEALGDDPWIGEARVQLNWPDEVIVRVRERVPVLWVESSEGWTWRAVDGVAVPGPESPDADSPRLQVSQMSEADLVDSELVRGTAEFVDALPPDVTAGLTVTVEAGELWAAVAGFDVRLGRPIEMDEKALSLTALLGEDLPDDAMLILVAPTHPAVEVASEPPTAGEGEAAGEGGDDVETDAESEGDDS